MNSNYSKCKKKSTENNFKDQNTVYSNSKERKVNVISNESEADDQSGECSLANEVVQKLRDVAKKMAA